MTSVYELVDKTPFLLEKLCHVKAWDKTRFSGEIIHGLKWQQCAPIYADVRSHLSGFSAIVRRIRAFTWIMRHINTTSPLPPPPPPPTEIFCLDFYFHFVERFYFDKLIIVLAKKKIMRVTEILFELQSPKTEINI